MPWYGFGFSAAVLAAVAAISEKWLLKRINVWQMSAWFSLMTAFLVIPFLVTFKGNLSSLRGVLWGVILVKAVLESIQFVSVMYGIKRLGISTTLPLMALSPGLVALGGSLIIGDVLTHTQWGGMLLMIVGLYLIQIEEGNLWWQPLVRLFIDRNQWVIVLALLVSVSVALLDKTILSSFKVPPQLFITVQQWYLAALFLIVLGIRRCFCVEPPVPWSGSLLFAIALLAVVTVGYRYFQMRGVMMAPVALVLSVRRTSVVMASLVGGSFFHEKGFLRRSLAAAVLAIGAVLLAQSV